MLIMLQARIEPTSVQLGLITTVPLFPSTTPSRDPDGLTFNSYTSSLHKIKCIVMLFNALISINLLTHD